MKRPRAQPAGVRAAHLRIAGLARARLGRRADKGGPYSPYRQSERVDLYRQDAARLLSEGKAYKVLLHPEELEAERRLAQAQKRPYKYSRRCLTDPPKDRAEFAVRLRSPADEIKFTDMVRGEMSFDADLIGDFILMKSDGYPTYQFASPIDDALMKISHVIRGEEHLSNTPYHLMVVDALGYDRPAAYAHMPLILAKDGAKLSKRKHPEANLMLYREQGYLPEALINYLALLVGTRGRPRRSSPSTSSSTSSRSSACSTPARDSTGRSSTGSMASGSAPWRTPSWRTGSSRSFPTSRSRRSCGSARAEDTHDQARAGSGLPGLSVDRSATPGARQRDQATRSNERSPL